MGLEKWQARYPKVKQMIADYLMSQTIKAMGFPDVHMVPRPDYLTDELIRYFKDPRTVVPWQRPQKNGRATYWGRQFGNRKGCELKPETMQQFMDGWVK